MAKKAELTPFETTCEQALKEGTAELAPTLLSSNPDRKKWEVFTDYRTRTTPVQKTPGLTKRVNLTRIVAVVPAGTDLTGKIWVAKTSDALATTITRVQVERVTPYADIAQIVDRCIAFPFTPDDHPMPVEIHLAQPLVLDGTKGERLALHLDEQVLPYLWVIQGDEI